MLACRLTMLFSKAVINRSRAFRCWCPPSTFPLPPLSLSFTKKKAKKYGRKKRKKRNWRKKPHLKQSTKNQSGRRALCRWTRRLEKDLEAGAHRTLDVQAPNVLPVLLAQRHKEVHGNHDVGAKRVAFHLNIADGGVQAKHLLHLELDLRRHVTDLCRDVLGRGDDGRELTGAVQAGAKKTRDLLDELGRGQEGIVLGSEFLD
mmetsp:Transcript_129645/g.314889  ORF Transcript_129645/g.314889 Transcript_129645/m.314889 type:complete len:203 (-) Transcript_129645:239-847(-)